MASQESLSNELKAQMLGLAQVVNNLSSSMIKKDNYLDKLPPVTQPQILAPAVPKSPPSLSQFNMYEDHDDDDYETHKKDEDEENETLVDGVESRIFKLS